MITRNRINLPERQVALIWQRLLGKELTTEEGERVRAVYPGRLNGDSGPDFRDVVIVNESSLMKGDVEIHTKSSDWYSHGHHTNAEYNNVILHVVGWHDCNSAILLQNGKLVPRLCLSTALSSQAYLMPYQQLPCSQILNHKDRETLSRVGALAPTCGSKDPQLQGEESHTAQGKPCSERSESIREGEAKQSQALRKLLDIAGEERFRQKAAIFQTELQREEAKQVLWRSWLRALGYSKNMKPFEELACRVPLNFIESIEPREGLVLKQAWLLGTAGLLPYQRLKGEFCQGEETRELERVWWLVSKEAKTMRENDWNFSHIYPNNSPVRRIIAQSYLLQRCYQEGLLRGILQLVKETPLTAGHHVLESGLIVAGDGYWQNHFDFDVRAKTKNSVLLGCSKAGEIIVNVVLPFVFSWGERELKEKARHLYLNYPKLAENEITRHMARQLCLKDMADFTACQQQGLIHIFRSYCREGRCAQCPLVN